MKYHFKIHREGEGFWAECLEIPGCMTQANSKEELLDNIQEAIHVFLEEPEGSDYIAPLPKPSIQCSLSIVEVPIDPAVALSYSIRRQRIQQGLGR